ncbi:MAG: ABC transporter permease, partial [Actinomycetota bacterium]|nr:ABC transporter permease [Actinomycetota bacterium]
MIRYIAKRVAYMLITLFLIISITFFISKLLPGTPFADDKLTPQIRERLYEKYSLDEPLYVQYAKYMLNVAQGDLGNSFYFESRPVMQMILERLPISAFIGIQAVIFGLLIGLALGIVAALRHNTWWDTAAVVVAVLGVSVPTFVLGPILQYVFGVKLEWFPIAFFESWMHSVLPSLALAVFVISTIARFTRSEMLEVFGQDYVTLARAKGLSGLAVILRHVLR